MQNVFKEISSSELGVDSGAYAHAFKGKEADQIANAQAYLGNISAALAIISTQRSNIGAYQSRLNSAIDTLTVNIENLSAARSTIQDTDVAVESSNYIKNQILQQSTTAMLSAANQSPSIALSLIS